MPLKCIDMAVFFLSFISERWWLIIFLSTGVLFHQQVVFCIYRRWQGGQACLVPAGSSSFPCASGFLHGTEPLPDKIQTIEEWPIAHCIRDVRAFFGLASYYRKFVRNFASIAEPLSRLTKKSAKFEWTDEAQEAFESLKRALIDVSHLTGVSIPRSPLCARHGRLGCCNRGCAVPEHRWGRKTHCVLFTGSQFNPTKLLHHKTWAPCRDLCATTLPALFAQPDFTDGSLQPNVAINVQTSRRDPRPLGGDPIGIWRRHRTPSG